MYETKITEFADHFFTHVNANKTNKNQSEKERPESHGVPRIKMKKKKKKKRKEEKQKVTLEPHNPDNLSRFIQEFAEVILGRDMNKIYAAFRRTSELSCQPKGCSSRLEGNWAETPGACESRHQLR